MLTMNGATASLPLTVVCAAVLAGCAGPDIGQKWPDPNRALMLSAAVTVDVGPVKHTEDSNLFDLDSEWEATVFRPRLVVDLRTRIGVEVSGEFSGTFTTEEEETWEFDGFEVGDNDMEITGYEYRALAGWGTDIQHFGRVSLFGGLAGRTVTLARDDDGDDSETEADLYFAEAELRLVVPLRQDLLDLPVTLRASASYGWLLSPEAEVEGAGTIEGNGGYLFRARAGFDFEVNRRINVYLGGFYEFMSIDGGREGLYEWADSETSAAGGEAGVRILF
jgi:hypothetical protein